MCLTEEIHLISKTFQKVRLKEMAPNSKWPKILLRKLKIPLLLTDLADDAVAELDAGHAAGEVGRGVAVGHVGDQLQAQLPVVW